MEFCDFNCRYAGWPEDRAVDGAGSCRTFQAVYCTKKGRLVHKNAPCSEKKLRRSRSLIEETLDGKTRSQRKP